MNKSCIPFSAIGGDHAIEHENRSFKVFGGIKGLANREIALEQYFLIGPEMNNIIEDFCSAFDIENMSSRRDEHHELSGSKNQRITENVVKLSTVFHAHSTNFDETECVYNTVTKKVLDFKFAEPFLAHEEEGDKLLQKYIRERLEGDKSIWDTMAKRKLPTFVSNVKSVTVKIKDQLVNVREEHKLISRFLVTCRTRHNIDLPHLGEYEFSVVPRSLFSPDGHLHHTTDKAEIVRPD